MKSKATKVEIVVVKLYKFKRLRNIIIKILNRIEGGEIHSITLREIFKKYYKINIGMYTHGGCFVPGQIDKYTTIGRYCSIANTVRIMNRNHPIEFKSTHGIFFNPVLKYCEKDLLKYNSLSVGNDVWIGHNAIILPHVRNIGDGAVIASGAVLNKDVPPYAIVVGNPARIVRYRFSKDKIEKLINSSWWEKDIDELKSNIHEFQKPYKNNEKYINGKDIID